MAFTWDLTVPAVGELVWPVPVDPSGKAGPTPGQARGPRWRRTSSNRYVASSVSPERVEQRILEQYARTSGRASVTGWAGLRLHRAAYFDGLDVDGRTPLPVPIACNGERLKPAPGLARTRYVVPPDEIEVIHGIRVATLERCLFDEMRRRVHFRSMVIAADMTFAAGLTSIARMRRYRAERRWYRDVRRIDEALDHADEHARSGPEVALRLVFELDARWDRPLCNRAVYDSEGRFVAVPDLIDPGRGVVGEYAGAHHRDKERHASDVAREADLRDVGLEYVEAVGRDLAQPDRLVRRIHEAGHRAAASTLPRRWRLAPPPSPTLDEWLDRSRSSSSDPRASYSTVRNRAAGSLDGKGGPLS